MTLLTCPRCGDLSDPGSIRCETCDAPLLVSATSLYPDAPTPHAAVRTPVGAGEAAQTRLGPGPRCGARSLSPRPQEDRGQGIHDPVLRVAFMRAHRAWSARFAPHLLEGWLDG